MLVQAGFFCYNKSGGFAVMEYRIVRSGRRTLALEVGRDLTVTVRAPLHTKKAEIERFVLQHQGWLQKALSKQQSRSLNIAAIGEEQLPLLKAAAEQYIPPRVQYFAKRMQLTPSAVKINSAKTRFGSCSAKNSLNFSCRVMIYPPEIIDYVIVHELAHIKHHNHSRAFYALIAEFLPDYKERILFLKEK